MRFKVLAGVAVVVAGAAFLGGYWPQRSERLAAEARAGDAETRLAQAEARVRTGELLGRMLAVTEMVQRQNYGQAMERSSAMFDAVRAEAAVTPLPEIRDALGQVLATRDTVTAALAKGDPAVMAVLTTGERRLRMALGYPVAPEPAPVSAPDQTPPPQAPSSLPGQPPGQDPARPSAPRAPTTQAPVPVPVP